MGLSVCFKFLAGLHEIRRFDRYHCIVILCMSVENRIDDLTKSTPAQLTGKPPTLKKALYKALVFCK